MADLSVHDSTVYDVSLSGGERVNASKIKLTRTGVELLNDQCSVQSILSFADISSIQIHQPIFGANYIDIEYTKNGVSSKLVVTFNKGGATQFAQSFFRATEGYVSDTSTPNETTERSKTAPNDTSPVYKSNKKDN